MYRLAILISAFFGNNKAKLFLQGRKNIFDYLSKTIVPGNILWMHAASLGEFEQGRPLLETLKEKYPHKKILLSFFSPSGYEVRKDYPLADYVVYLPLDTQKNARKFIQLQKPDLAIFVK